MLDVKALLTKILLRLSNIGTIYDNSTNKTITNTAIDNNTVGASITLPAGTYFVVGQWTFNTRDTTGTTNSAVRILNDAGTAIAQTRVFASAYNWNSLQCSTTVKLSAGGSLRVCGATSRPYTTASQNWIRAIKIS